MFRTTGLIRLLLRKKLSTDTDDFLQCLNSAGAVQYKIDKDGNVTGGSVTAAGSLTVPTGQTAVVTDADALTVGGVIVPQHIEVSYVQNSGETTATRGFFIANRAYKVVAVKQRHSTVGSDGGTVSVSLYKDPSGTAPGGGTALLTAALSLKATINTAVAGALSATPADLALAAGDLLTAVFAGAQTAVAGCVLTVTLKRI